LTNLATPWAAPTDAVAEVGLFSEGVVLVGSGSPITSRSNCAKDKSRLSGSLPMLEVVVKDGVTDTNDTSCASNSSTGVAKSALRKSVELIH